MWQGTLVITDYKPTPPPCNNNNVLNNDFGWFEALNTTPAGTSVPRPDEQPLSLDTADVRRTLREVKSRKEAGPEDIPGQVPKEYAD